MKHRVRNRGKGKRAEHELSLLPLEEQQRRARSRFARDERNWQAGVLLLREGGHDGHEFYSAEKR